MGTRGKGTTLKKPPFYLMRMVIMNCEDLQNHFYGEIAIEQKDGNLIVIASNERETLSNELLNDLLFQGLTLKRIELHYQYEDEETGEHWNNGILWEFVPMNALQ